jgi:hypothetical protein
VNIWDRILHKRKAEQALGPGDFNRAGRRARGWRGRLHAVSRETFLPRYVRRHANEVIALPFTWRTRNDMWGRRERKVRNKIDRLNRKYGLG